MSKLDEMLAELANRTPAAQAAPTQTQGAPNEPTEGLAATHTRPSDPAAAELADLAADAGNADGADAQPANPDDGGEGGDAGAGDGDAGNGGAGEGGDAGGADDAGDADDIIDLTDDGDDSEGEGGDAGDDGNSEGASAQDPANAGNGTQGAGEGNQNASEGSEGGEGSEGTGEDQNSQGASEGDEGPSDPESGASGGSDPDAGGASDAGQAGSTPEGGEGSQGAGESGQDGEDHQDESFDEEGQLISVAEVKAEEAQSDKIVQASEIIKEASEISDRLKDLAREIIDRNQGFDPETDGVAIESFARIASFSVESLEAQAANLFEDGYRTDEGQTPEVKAIRGLFDTAGKQLASASRIAGDLLDAGFSKKVDDLRTALQTDFVNPTVVLEPEVAEAVHIDGTVSLDHLRVGGQLLQSLQATGVWLKTAIGPYLKACAKGEFALLPVLTTGLVSDRPEVAQRLRDLTVIQSNDVSAVLPGNVVFGYLGANGAQAYFDSRVVKSKVTLPGVPKLTNLTAVEIAPLFNELLVLGKAVNAANRLLNLLSVVVPKLEAWYQQADATEARIVRHVGLGHFIVAITRPVLSQFYLVGTLYTAILAILQEAKRQPTETPEAPTA